MSRGHFRLSESLAHDAISFIILDFVYIIERHKSCHEIEQNADK